MKMPSPQAFRLIVLSLVLVFGGCATSGSGRVADRDLISHEMIQRSSASNVLQLIERERPTWLRSRGGITARADDDGIEQVPVIVYVDNSRFGTADDLASLSTHGITEVRRLSARDATQRFGTGHPRGAIIVSTRP